MYLTRSLRPLRVVAPLPLAAGQCAPPPPVPYSQLTSTLEVNMTSGGQGSLQPYLSDSLTYYVNDAYQNAAAVDFRWLPGNSSLPGPGTAGDEWWPVQDLASYDAYARSHGTSGGEFDIQFHVFFVGHSGSNVNPSQCGGVYYGITSSASLNQYVSDPRDRFSFMFVPDLESVLDACVSAYGSNFFGPDQRLNIWTGALVHELGHQRAGLTHTGDYFEYHASQYYSTDIMRGGILPLDLAAARLHVFCRSDEVPPVEGNTASCQGNLLRNRQVY